MGVQTDFASASSAMGVQTDFAPTSSAMGAQTDSLPVCFAAEDLVLDPAIEDSAAEYLVAANPSARLFAPSLSAEVLAPGPTPTPEVFTLDSIAKDPESGTKDPGPSEVFVPSPPEVFVSSPPEVLVPGSPDEVLAPRSTLCLRSMPHPGSTTHPGSTSHPARPPGPLWRHGRIPGRLPGQPQQGG